MSSFVIPFRELAPGADVRFTTIGGRYYMSVRDLIMVVCEKSAKAASQTWSRDVSEEQHRRSERVQDVIEFQGALKLIMWLPGNGAKDFRGKATKILERYFAGDSSLLKEIEKNAASNAPINQLARASLASAASPRDVENDEYDRKRRRQIEDLELEERRSVIQMRAAEAMLKTTEVQRNLIEGYTALCPNKTIDERARIMFKDSFLNLIPMGSQKAITNGDGGSAGAGGNGNAPITISTLATRLGLKFSSAELITIGKEVAKRYKARYNQEPPKHEQICGGAVRPVCSYTEKDRALVEEVLRTFAEEQ